MTLKSSSPRTQHWPKGQDSLLPSLLSHRTSDCFFQTVETFFFLNEHTKVSFFPPLSHSGKVCWTNVWKEFCEAFPNQVRSLMRLSPLILLFSPFLPLLSTLNTPTPPLFGCHCNSLAFAPQSAFLLLPFSLPPSWEAEKEAQRRRGEKEIQGVFSLPGSLQEVILLLLGWPHASQPASSSN